MRKRAKELVEVGDGRSLEALIEQLVAIRDRISGVEAEVKVRADDVFGHRLVVCYDEASAPEATGLERGSTDQILRAAA